MNRHIFLLLEEDRFMYYKASYNLVIFKVPDSMNCYMYVRVYIHTL